MHFFGSYIGVLNLQGTSEYSKEWVKEEPLI